MARRPPSSLVVDSVERMPNLSPTVAKVLALVNDPNSSAKDLIRVIQVDPVLTGKVLALCNSAYFGIAKKISSVARATILLGMNTIKNLTLTTAVLALFSSSPKRARFDPANFWRHSLGCAVCCRMIAALTKLSPVIQEEFFVAGLMHDVGRLVIVHQLPDVYRRIAEDAASARRPVMEAEIEALGEPHTEIGMLLADKWRLAEHLGLAIGFHHAPLETEKFGELTAACYLSDNYCEVNQIGYGGDETTDEFAPEAASRLGMAAEAITGELDGRLEEELEKASIFVVGTAK